MGMEGEAADLLARQCIQIAEATLKLSGTGAKNLAALFYAMAKNPGKLRGKTKMQKFIRGCNSAARVFPIKQEDLKQFNKMSKEYGLLWAPVKSRGNGDTVDLLCRAEDVSAVNRIFERMGYAAPVKEDAAPKKADARAHQERDSVRRGSGLSSSRETMTAASDRPSVRGRLESLRAISGQTKAPVKGPKLPSQTR